jgi:hypothetical protein
MTTYGPDEPGIARFLDAPADDSIHKTVGAYAIGVLEPAEAAAFEEHLAGCERCAEQLDELVGMGPLLAALADLPAGEDAGPDAPRARDRAAELVARPTPGLADRLLVDVAAHRRRRRRRARYLVAAAAALIVAGPLTTLAVESGTGTADTSLTADSVALRHMPHRVSATDAKTKVSATIGFKHETWGTNTVLELTHLRGPLKCELIAVGTDGSRETMSSWSVSQWGYGIPDSTWPGSKDPLYVHGSTALDGAHLDHFEVRTFDGRELVSVDAQRAGPHGSDAK